MSHRLRLIAYESKIFKKHSYLWNHETLRKVRQKHTTVLQCELPNSNPSRFKRFLFNPTWLIWVMFNDSFRIISNDNLNRFHSTNDLCGWNCKNNFLHLDSPQFEWPSCVWLRLHSANLWTYMHPLSELTNRRFFDLQCSLCMHKLTRLLHFLRVLGQLLIR